VRSVDGVFEVPSDGIPSLSGGSTLDLALRWTLSWAVSSHGRSESEMFSIDGCSSTSQDCARSVALLVTYGIQFELKKISKYIITAD
jgi:hypothetical protein